MAKTRPEDNPEYHIYRGAEKLNEFKLFNKQIVNSNYEFFSLLYLVSNDKIKPDNSKIAMSMMAHPQINILDLNTGALSGFRKKNGIDFKDLEKSDELRIYYTRVDVDNHYIFRMYTNKLMENLIVDEFTNEVHVFDWEGKAVKRLIFEHEFDNMTLDSKNKKLYMKNGRDEVYCYDIAYIYK